MALVRLAGGGLRESSGEERMQHLSGDCDTLASERESGWDFVVALCDMVGKDFVLAIEYS